MLWVIMFISFLIMIMVSCYVTLRNRESFKISECPASGDPFKHKKFVRDCYAHEASSCKAVLDKLKIDPYSMGLSQEDTDTSLGMISNNLYVSVDANDPTKYSLNECVIPEALRTDLDLQQCTIDDVQLRSSNPEDPGIAWTYKNGCIISEDQIRQHFPKILKYVNDKRKEIKEGIKTSLSDGINDNTSATSVHNSNTKTNNDDTSIKKGLASDARLVKATSISTTQSLANMQTWYIAHEPKVQTNANNEQTRYNNMKKDCVVTWSKGACLGKCGTGKITVTPSFQQPLNGGNACPNVGPYTENCDTGISCKQHFDYTFPSRPFIPGNTMNASLIWNKMGRYWSGVGTPDWLCDRAPYNQAAFRQYEYIYDSNSESDIRVIFYFQADNRCTLVLNNVQIGSSSSWETTSKVAAALKYGKNRILLNVTNDDPGGAGGAILSCARELDLFTPMFTTSAEWRMK